MTKENEDRGTRVTDIFDFVVVGDDKLDSIIQAARQPSLRAPAKQSIARQISKNGLLRSYAPRNDVDRSEHDFLFSRRIAPEVLLETLLL